jgi:hypothetical protein
VRRALPLLRTTLLLESSLRTPPKTERLCQHGVERERLIGTADRGFEFLPVERRARPEHCFANKRRALAGLLQVELRPLERCACRALSAERDAGGDGLIQEIPSGGEGALMQLRAGLADDLKDPRLLHGRSRARHKVERTCAIVIEHRRPLARVERGLIIARLERRLGCA